MPRQGLDQLLRNTLSDQGLFQPSQTPVTRPWSGDHSLEVLAQSWDQVVHVLESLQGIIKTFEGLYPVCPPVRPRQGKLWCDQRHRVLLNPEGRSCLGLPCHHLNCRGCHLESPRAGVLHVIEAGTATHLKPDQPHNECINGPFGMGDSANGSRTLFQGPDHFPRRHHRLTLRSRGGGNQCLLKVLLL